MSEPEKRAVWPWIVALVVGVPVLYVASFGPACWITCRVCRWSVPTLSAIYRPMVWTMQHSDKTGTVIVSYAQLVAKPEWHWGEMADGDWMWAEGAL